jgi:hypothetical protein
MPSIQFYADETDFASIVEKLNDDPEIAFILPAGRNWIGRAKCIAQQRVDSLEDGSYLLWYVDGGALPSVTDPWKGWTQPAAASPPGVPFFGNIPQIIELGVRRMSREKPGGVGQSSFGWIGDRYRSTGSPAADATKKWWRRWNDRISKSAVKRITRWGDIDGPDADIWVFPSAHEKIVAGMHRDMNPMG